MSLVPSVTESLLAWNADVVGCTRFCEQPHLVHVGGTKDPDINAIVRLAPDLVVVDREENRREDADALTRAGLALHVTHVVHLHDVAATLRGMAAALGIRPPIAELSAPATTASPVTAFVPIWRRPTMTFNGATYASSLLDHLGVVNVLGDHADRYPHVELADVAGLHPQLVLLPSEPYPFGPRHVAAYEREVPGAQAVLVDGRDLFWWGVRTAGAIDRLRAVLRAASTPS